MKVLFDTNVILDVLLDREEFAESSVSLMVKAENGEIDGCLGSTTVTTIHYLVSKYRNKKVAGQAINKLLQIFNIAAVDKKTLLDATQSSFLDYEDAVLHQAAMQANLDAIVTRNVKDFKHATLPIYQPLQLLHALAALRTR